MEPGELYIRVGRLIEAMPTLSGAEIQAMRPETLKWFGDAYALANVSGDMISAVELKSEIDKLTQNAGMAGISVDRVISAARRIPTILYRILAEAELTAPAEYQGSFIPAGSAFDAIGAIAKVFSSVTNEVLIVDAYLDEKVLTDFAVLLPEGMNIRLLTGITNHKPSLPPVASRWSTQHGVKRPLEIRLAEDKSLHDRLIIVDNRDTWVLTQSLNTLATRSPATIVRFNDENNSKKEWYEDVWSNAQTLNP